MKSTSPQLQISQYLGPKFWPTWLVLGLMWLVARLPFGWQLVIGASLGRLMYYGTKRRRHIAETNIRLAFPKLTTKQQKALVKDNFRSSGIALIEIGFGWWGSEKSLRRLAHIEGLEHVHQALENGKGAIMLSGHFTCLIITGRMLAQELPFNIVTKKAHNELFEAFMRRHRSRHYQGLIDSNDMRGMIKTLRNNQVVWYAPDQDFRHKASVFVPFMGIQTATLTTTARLAKISKSPVIYTRFERLPGTQGYKLKLYPPLQDFPSGDDSKDARRVNELIEQQVHEVPDQYLWIHRRFKTRPPGEPQLYGWADKKPKPQP